MNKGHESLCFKSPSGLRQGARLKFDIKVV